MTEDIEEKYGCMVSKYDMSLVHFDEFVNGKLVSVPCKESVGKMFEKQMLEQEVQTDGNGILDADYTIDDRGWLALIVEDDEDAVKKAARVLHSKVDRPVNLRD